MGCVNVGWLRRSIEIVLSCMVLDFDSIVFICALLVLEMVHHREV